LRLVPEVLFPPHIDRSFIHITLEARPGRVCRINVALGIQLVENDFRPVELIDEAVSVAGPISHNYDDRTKVEFVTLARPVRSFCLKPGQDSFVERPCSRYLSDDILVGQPLFKAARYVMC